MQPVQLVRILVHQQLLVDDGLVGGSVDHLCVVSSVQPLTKTKHLYTRQDNEMRAIKKQNGTHLFAIV